MPERTLTDAEALDLITERYRTWGMYEIFENSSSTIESIGDLLEATGREAWLEEGEYLSDDGEGEDG